MGKLEMDVHFECRADGLPSSCCECKFNVLDAACGLDVNCYRGYEYVVRKKYTQQRHKDCPLRYTDD